MPPRPAEGVSGGHFGSDLETAVLELDLESQRPSDVVVEVELDLVVVELVDAARMVAVVRGKAVPRAASRPLMSVTPVVVDRVPPRKDP